MKNIRNIFGLVVVMSIAISIQSCKTKTENTTEKKELAQENAYRDTSKEGVSAQVYYFHATRRCATCEAVEKVSKEFIEENYAEKVSFVSINREEDQNSDLVNKYEIAGQTLLVIFESEVVDLTTKAFLNARNSPEKLEELLKSTLDSKQI